ncbi:transglycosylase SLT domain-containing protein [Rhodococcus erythropolis]|uniref:transglycosylase SLT domain-containing protein n=1 Tax=Rhodococcus erythropolis TaxID=1833 RepID=UPI00118756EF|nr:transglycosylase SLT domain-containing protein [Rhodococcus erythropolis]
MQLRSERVEAPVIIVPDLNNFKQRLEAGLGRYNASLKVKVSPDLSGFRQQLRTDLAATSVDSAVAIPVRLDLTVAREQLRAFRVEASRAMHADFDLDITAALAQLAALRAASQGIGSVGGIGSIGTAASGIISPIGLATAALVGLAAVSLVPLIGQLAQAAGVISLLPAVAASAAAGIATIVIGSTGVFDAFAKGSKSAEEAAKNAAKTAKQQATEARERASAAKAVANAERGVEKAADGVARAERGVGTALDNVERAERGVTQAQKRSEDAQKSLTRARKDAQEQIEDLKLSLRGAELDERGAEQAVRRAERQLRDLWKDNKVVTPDDVAEATLNVDEAKFRLDEVRERNGDLREEVAAANQAGVEGSEQVVSAKEAIADADQGVIDSQKSLADSHLAVADAQGAVLDAQQNLADSQEAVIDAQQRAAEATTANADAVDEYAAALANLSPNARAFVEDTRSLGDAWKDLRLQIQDNLFAGLGGSITDLATNYFPILKNGLGGIATEINIGLKGAIADLSSESSKLDWTNILENTRISMQPVIDGLSDLFGGLTNIASIGSDFLPGLSGSFADTMKSFQEWTASEEGQNKIRTFMEDSIRAFGEIKDLFVEIGRVVGGLFSTSDEAGQSMVKSLTDTMREFADWMRTAEGQQKMRDFWEDVRRTITDILTLVKEAGILVAQTTDLINRAFPTEGAPVGVFGAANSASKGDFGGALRSLGGVAGDSYASIFRAAGVPGANGGAINMGIGNIKKTWGWLSGLFGGDGGGDGNLPSPENGEGFTPNTNGNGIAFLPNTVPGPNVGGGRSGGQKQYTREEWEKTFGDVEEFDRKLEELQLKSIETQRIGSSEFGTFGSNAAQALISLGTGDFSNFKSSLGDLAKNILGTTEDGQTNWGNLGSKIGEVVGNITGTIFPGLKEGLGTLLEFGRGIVEGFGGNWDRLKGMAADPINWIIDNVINGALKNAWNAVSRVIPGLKEWDGVDRVGTGEVLDARGNDGGKTGYATGGILPGYTPGRDVHEFASPTGGRLHLSGGEAVMRPEWTQAMGSGYVNGMNAAARAEGVAGVKKRMQYFANGGIVESMTSAVQEKFGAGMQMTSGLRYTDNGYHSQGMAADFSNGYSSTPEMRQLAGWIADNFAGRTIELIHDPFNRNIGAGNPVGDGYGFYGAGTMAEHNNHVHWAVTEPVGPGGDPADADGGGLMGSVRRLLGGAVNSARSVAASTFDKTVSGIGAGIPDFGPTLMGQLPKAAFTAIKDAMTTAIRGASGPNDSGSTPFDIGAGAEQWRSKAIEALQREGFDASERNQNLMLAQIQSESGGNPNIVQSVQDVNSGGNEAVGLLQVIPGTFATYRNPDLPNDRTDPDASMSAALRYYRSRYGDDLGAMWGQGHGYALGGIIPGYSPGQDKFQVGVSGGESIMRPEWTRAVGSSFVDGMNSIARKQGVEGVQRAMGMQIAGMFAEGGVFTPEEQRLYLEGRISQFGTQAGDIAKKALPEILGVQGTPLDPNHRYWQAAMDINAAVQGAQAVAPVVSDQAGSNSIQSAIAEGGRVIEEHIHYHVTDIDEAIRKERIRQKQQATSFTGR